jgi:predicted amidophosphoribosyltransferase
MRTIIQNSQIKLSKCKWNIKPIKNNSVFCEKMLQWVSDKYCDCCKDFKRDNYNHQKPAIDNYNYNYNIPAITERERENNNQPTVKDNNYSFLKGGFSVGF